MNLFAIIQHESPAITVYGTHSFGLKVIGAGVGADVVIIGVVGVTIGATDVNTDKLCKHITCPTCNALQFIYGLFDKIWLKLTPALAAITSRIYKFIFL
jgi:hypothetical protein